MEITLEHVLLFFLFVFLFRQVKCNRQIEGMIDFTGDKGSACTVHATNYEPWVDSCSSLLTSCNIGRCDPQLAFVRGDSCRGTCEIVRPSMGGTG
jgi:hypothetical protein